MAVNYRDLFNLKYPHLVCQFNTYEEAQKVVDFLADKNFPVQKMSIVGTDLKLIERVMGRRTWANVLGQGAISGIGTGLLVGVMISFIGRGQDFLSYLVIGLFLGVIIGMVTSAIGYLMTAGKRDFNSIRQTVAAKYQVYAEHNVVEKAKELLMELPEYRSQMFQ